MSTNEISASQVELQIEEEKIAISDQGSAPAALQQEIRLLVEQIRTNNNDPSKCYSQLNKLDNMYYDKKTRSFRKSIAEVFCECGYATCLTALLQTMKDRNYYPEGIDVIKNPLMWKTSKLILDNVWNYSDCSDEFSRELARSDMIEVLLGNLKKYPNKDPSKGSNQYFIIQATLSAMCNIARRPENKYAFHKYTPPPSKLIFEFRFSKDNNLKVLAFATLAYIVDEKEAKKVTEDPDTVRTIVHWMGISVSKDQYKRIKEGFTAAELAYALDKLAIDGNVKRIIDSQALMVLYRMICSPEIDQQINATKCLWTLAFNKDARRSIKEYKSLLNRLRSMKTEETNTVLLQNINGALWVLDEKIDEEPLQVDSGQPKHLFISYCWSEQETVKKIWQKLLQKGYNVWIDLERMSNDVLEGMSSAVESSSMVIICVSEGYKQSQCCRTEAGYTYKRKKGFIPLYMQKPYDPDGWLGALLSSKLYFDFSGNTEVEFEDSMRKLFRELNTQGVLSLQSEPNTPVSPEIPKEVVSKLETKSPFSPSVCYHPESTPSSITDCDDSVFSDRSSQSFNSWTTQAVTPNVCTTIISRGQRSVVTLPSPQAPESFSAMDKQSFRHWLNGHNLGHLSENMKNMDGKLLWQLKCMKAEAPDFFYRFLTDEFELKAFDLLSFRAALEDLS